MRNREMALRKVNGASNKALSVQFAIELLLLLCIALIGGLPRGDVDGSGGIDSTDIFYTMLYIANVAVGNDGGLTDEQIAAADVDGNGTVDSTDSFYIMYYVALHGAGHNTSWEEVLAK